jgi:PTH1 family peptidyl-tRNA hydrolase
MHLLIGLGNPGEDYRDTRHNLGFRVAEDVARTVGLAELKYKKKCHALVGEAIYEGRKLVIAEPQTFMNLSGDAARELLSWYKIGAKDLIVAHDDVDLEVGQIRVRMGGGAGGHHGIESIMERIGASDFIRIRIGVGRPSVSGDVSEYVLLRVPKEERPVIDISVANAAEAVLFLLNNGLEKTKNKYNGIKPSK